MNKGSLVKVYHAPQQIRVVFLLIALLTATSAMLVRSFELLPLVPRYSVSGTFESGLLTDLIDFYAVQAVVGTDRFQSVTRANIDVTPVSGFDRRFALIARSAELSKAEDGLRHAEELLKLELKSLAVAEVATSRAYVEELRNEARRWRSESGEVQAPAGEVETLQRKEIERGIQLRREAEGIRSYLDGNEEPEWLMARLDRDALERVEARLISAKAELYKVASVFQPESRAVREQTEVLKKVEKERHASIRFLAKSLLESNLLELQNLEEKSLVRIAQNNQIEEVSSSDTVEDDSETEASAWLAEQSQKLDERANRLESQATLTQIGETEIHFANPIGYWVTMGLWLSALCSLLGALFSGGGDTPNSKKGKRRHAKVKNRQSDRESQRIETVRVPGKRKSNSEPDPFFVDIRQRFKQELGDTPSRILVLGASDTDSRSALALRLAKNFSDESLPVRLVDFDLQGRLLSRRLGEEGSLGVSDVLLNSGPVEEFFASISGTSIQFAPAGTSASLEGGICEKTLKALLVHPHDGVTLVDASFTSPVELIVGEVEAVLCMTCPQAGWREDEKSVLLTLREAGLPIWGLAPGASGFFPYI